MSRQTSLAYLALLATMVIWGTSAVYMRKTALELTPENAIAFRYFLLAAVIIPALALTGGWRIAKADWPRLLVASFVGMFGYNWFINEGFARIAAGLGTIITMVEPFFIAILAAIFLREKISAKLVLGMLIAIAGAAILFWPDLMHDTKQPVDLWGIICLICAAMAWAIYTIASKPLLSRYSSFAITGWTMLLCAPVLIVLASTPMATIATSLTPQQWAELIFLAAGSGLIGNLLWNIGVKHAPGSVAGTFLYLIPVIAVAAGYLILNEAITPYLVAGGIVMLAGVAVAQSGASH